LTSRDPPHSVGWVEDSQLFGMERAEGPCAEARSQAESPCSEAVRLKVVAREAAVALQVAMRELGQAARELEDADSAVDVNLVTDAKVAARTVYRRQLQAATTVAERRGAVTAWWREIDRINGRTRRADEMLERANANSIGRQQAMAQAERLAHARRIRAEAAAQACVEARQRLAVCEEQTGATLMAGAVDALLAVDGLGSDDGTGDMGSHAPMAASAPDRGGNLNGSTAWAVVAPAVLVDVLGRAAQQEEPFEPSEDLPVLTPLVAELLFEGDRSVVRWLADELSELTGQPPSHFLLLLQELLDAVELVAAERRFLVFDAEHPLWSQFSQNECRTIAGALSDLGFRYDPRDGWNDGRVPNTNDVSIAIAYAGFDARRVRGMPATPEGFRVLAASISASPLELVRESAPELTITQLIGVLGPRADALDDLWDDWGRLRPLLLTEASALMAP
jgi:hypothetical protein